MESKVTTLTDTQFNKISQLLYQISGITLQHGKEELVKARLGKRLRVLGLNNYDEYLTYINNDTSRNELSTMTDALTTNKTSFFRETQHFEFLQKHILPNVPKNSRNLRIWCAGCSSGEEPYSLGIILNESIPNIYNWDIKVLATDISPTMLQKAREAIYSEDLIMDVAPSIKRKYFKKVNGDSSQNYQVHDKIKSLIKFARLNLMGPWQMRGPFDVIFCRNVMIYFDRITREKLIHRFWKLIKPHGFLFVGHSESLTGGSNLFQYIQPATYMK